MFNTVDMPYKRLVLPVSSEFRVVLPLKPFLGYTYATHDIYSKSFFEKVDKETILTCIGELTRFIDLSSLYRPVTIRSIIDLLVYTFGVIAFVVVLFIQNLDAIFKVVGVVIIILFEVLYTILVTIFTQNY
jgi:hypothetical protein